jgi:hypothetical protein
VLAPVAAVMFLGADGPGVRSTAGTAVWRTDAPARLGSRGGRPARRGHRRSHRLQGVGHALGVALAVAYAVLAAAIGHVQGHQARSGRDAYCFLTVMLCVGGVVLCARSRPRCLTRALSRPRCLTWALSGRATPASSHAPSIAPSRAARRTALILSGSSERVAAAAATHLPRHVGAGVGLLRRRPPPMIIIRSAPATAAVSPG